jgi:hypothetical protein
VAPYTASMASWSTASGGPSGVARPSSGRAT